MWLFTTFGFFSIVQKQSSDGFLTVRARAADDLDRLRNRVPQLSPTIVGGGTDYPYRAKIPHADPSVPRHKPRRVIRNTHVGISSRSDLFSNNFTTHPPISVS